MTIAIFNKIETLKEHLRKRIKKIGVSSLGEKKIRTKKNTLLCCSFVKLATVQL